MQKIVELDAVKTRMVESQNALQVTVSTSQYMLHGDLSQYPSSLNL